MPLTILLTGFGPFPGAPFNPASSLPVRLATRRRPALHDVRRVAHVFRTSYAAVDAELPKVLARERPDAVLLFGVATRTNYLRIETRARNARSVLFSDVDGRRGGKAAIRLGGPGAIVGRASHHLLLTAAKAARVPAKLSHSAGRYLCNFVYWRALEEAASGNRPALVQFIHLPMVRSAPVRQPLPAGSRSLAPAALVL